MTPEALADLHALSFTVPRPWTAAEFAGFLRDPNAFLLSRDQGFLLGRAVAGEAELLTVAVAPTARRQGLGRALTQGFALTARQRRASEAFLEVASTNSPAIALYQSLGWQQVGRRAGYYAPGIDALTLRLPL